MRKEIQVTLRDGFDYENEERWSIGVEVPDDTTERETKILVKALWNAVVSFAQDKAWEAEYNVQNDGSVKITTGANDA